MLSAPAGERNERQGGALLTQHRLEEGGGKTQDSCLGWQNSLQTVGTCFPPASFNIISSGVRPGVLCTLYGAQAAAGYLGPELLLSQGVAMFPIYATDVFCPLRRAQRCHERRLR